MKRFARFAEGVGAPHAGFFLLSRKVRSGDPDNVEAEAALRPRNYSGLVIEGQPQQGSAVSVASPDYSGLVIEGQLQLAAHVRLCPRHYSGLVIEGQPQPITRNTVIGGNYSGLVIEGQPQLQLLNEIATVTITVW
jgi:hypothetical protein